MRLWTYNLLWQNILSSNVRNKTILVDNSKNNKRNIPVSHRPNIAQCWLSDNRPLPVTGINRRIWNDVKEMMVGHK